MAGEIPVAPPCTLGAMASVGRARYRSPGAWSSRFGAFFGGEPSSSLIARSYATRVGTVSSPTVTHPSLGLPPSSLTTGFPEAAERLRTQGRRLATRAVEVAANEDPTYADRIGDAGLRNLLEDATVFIDRLALCVAGDDSHWLREFADQTATVYRRRGISLDDVIKLFEGIRASIRGVLTADELVPADAALDDSIAVFRFHRRLAGDARKRNPIIAALYKGG
jgi:hypothetical protein